MNVEKRIAYLSLTFSLMAHALFFSTFLGMAFAQYYSSAATPAQLQECRALGISPLNCNDSTILSRYCIGGAGTPCHSIPSSSMYFEPDRPFTIFLVPVGAAIAAGAAIVAVKKVRILKPKHLRKARLLYFGMAIAFFGIALLAYNAAFGNDCWGTEIFESGYGAGVSSGTLAEPIFCSFWFSYRFVGVALVLGGATIFSYSRLRYREEISV
jgi:hypothetical protein